MRKALTHLRAADPVMAELIGRVGPYRIAYRPASFDTLARSIVYQQLSTKAAGTIYNRLLELAGGGQAEVTPAAILKQPTEALRAMGLSQQKVAYVRALAEATHEGVVDFGKVRYLRDEQVIRHLTQVKGVGVWTAQMFLIFALKRPDVLPLGDLGVRAGMQKVYGLPALPAPLEMERLAQPWRPYRSVASWYLWRSLDGSATL